MIARQLRVIRQQNRLTQQDIADVLGVTRSTYSSYESGRRNPDIDTVLTLASFYRMSLDKFFGDVNKQYAYDSTYYEGQEDNTYLSQLSKEERNLIVKFRQKTEKEQMEILKLLENKEKSKD